MTLVRNRSYFIRQRDVVLREKASGNSEPVNHLLFGDWLRYRGETQNGWAKVRCRGCNGWLPLKAFGEERPLEINFVDIGQGDGCHIVTPDDQVILIDAGEGDNMARFISWRYNLRSRKAPQEGGPEPFPIQHTFISHPDKDHYFGFRELFEERRLRFEHVYHNGIVERPIGRDERLPGLHYPSREDLGGYLEQDDERYLWEVVSSSSAMHTLINRHRRTRKQYLGTLVRVVENNPDVKFVRLRQTDGYVPDFEADKPVALKVLGPITERRVFNGTHRDTMIRLGREGVTKNGHSIILQLQIGKLRVMLGGDLNTESQDYLFKYYGQTDRTVSRLERRILQLQALGPTADADQRQELAELVHDLDAIITRARGHLQTDVTKACHHGSHHFSESFLKALNAIATVISSGDAESYSHPRPDALGSFGRYGRGARPLIFSTELARSTREFTPFIHYVDKLRAYERRLADATSARERRRIEKQMQEARDRNVAVYGMITLRSDGERAILAQKLEVPAGKDQKWDIHELRYNANTRQFEYCPSARGH